MGADGTLVASRSVRGADECTEIEEGLIPSTIRARVSRKVIQEQSQFPDRLFTIFARHPTRDPLGVGIHHHGGMVEGET